MGLELGETKLSVSLRTSLKQHHKARSSVSGPRVYPSMPLSPLEFVTSKR